MFSKNNFHFWFCLATKPFYASPQFILNEPKEDSSVSGSCSHVASSLHERALTCLCGQHSELCSQTVISGSVSEPRKWFPWQNVLVFNPVLSKGSWTSSTDIWPSRRADVSPDSLNHLMLLCPVNGEIFKVQLSEPWLIFTSEKLCLSQTQSCYRPVSN